MLYVFQFFSFPHFSFKIQHFFDVERCDLPNDFSTLGQTWFWPSLVWLKHGDKFLPNWDLVTVGLARQLSGVRSEVSGPRSQVPGLRFQVSGFRFQVSGFRLQVSGFRLQVSGFRFQISDFRFRVSGFRFQISVMTDFGQTDFGQN